MKYRKLYESHYGIKIPPGYEIHHIDQNRNNNDIDNLILLPKKLHSQLHWVHNILSGYFNGTDSFLITMNNIHHCHYLSSTIEMWRNLCEELPQWITRKENEDSRIDGFGLGELNYDMFREKL